MAKDKRYKLLLPSSLDAIPLHQYQKYVKVINEHKDNVDEEFLRLKLLEIFCGLTMREAYELAAVDVDGIIEILVNVLNSESPLQRRFTMTDPKGIAVEFGFIPNLERISLGEFIDAEAYISDWDNMHKAMAVLYRPLTGNKGEFYEIEKYEGSDKYAAIMADAPASVAIGAMLFFYRLGMTLSLVTLRSLVPQAKTDLEDQQAIKSLSPKSGDGISPSMLSLEETYLESVRSLEEIYTNASFGLSLKKRKAS